MIMARNEDGTYNQVGFVKDSNGIDTEYIYDKDGDIVFEKGFTRETSGTVPLTINGIGKDLKDWSITGNTVQNGTPTPNNPIEVQAVGDRTANIFPAGEKKTVVSNGVTFDSDGSGRYHISGTASAHSSVSFNLVSGFTAPISVSNGGQGTLSFFNTQRNNSVTFAFYNGTTKVDDWTMMSINRTSVAYNVIGNKYVDKVIIIINSGATVDMTIMPEFTNDGVLPSGFEPYGYKIPVVTRGKNLFDYKTMYGVKDKYLNENGEILDSVGNWSISDYIPCSGTVFTINSIGGILPAVCLYDSHKNFITGHAYDTGGATFKKPVTIKSETNASYIRFSYCVMSETSASDDLSKIQIEEGTTATPYEPYHEPITTPIYLDSPLYKIGDHADRLSKTEEIRVVKELVLTGEENWHAQYNGFTLSVTKQSGRDTVLSTHYKASTSTSIDKGVYSESTNVILIFDSDYTTLADFKAYLAAQYAAGTPVKVYYVMQTPETKTVEPVEIPTINDTTVIDVDTKVEPSDIYIKYKSSK